LTIQTDIFAVKYIKIIIKENPLPKVAIVTDSVASIPITISQELNIRWVPYYVHRGSEALRDLVSIDCESFYKWLPNAEALPTTANPSSSDYEEVYIELVESGIQEIVSIHITSKGSGAYQAATIAKNTIMEQFPDLKIEVIDSLNVSMCQGWMAIEAARAALEGATLENIILLVRDMIPITQMLQTADTLKYLYMGGRIGAAKHLVGSLLSIKPIISMKDGVIVSLGQARSRNKVYQMMVERIEKTIGRGRKIKVAYTHAAAMADIEKLKNLVEDRLTVAESLISELPPALGVHTGPGTAGLCYFPVKD
jgi:DegV family protein with EDD domain